MAHLIMIQIDTDDLHEADDIAAGIVDNLMIGPEPDDESLNPMIVQVAEINPPAKDQEIRQGVHTCVVDDGSKAGDWYYLPNAQVECDNEGQIVVYTNLSKEK